MADRGTASGEGALANLVRVAVDDPDGSDVRGHRGSVGPSILTTDQVADQMPAQVIRAWLEDGMIVYVGASGVPEGDVDRFVESLRPLRRGDIERLRDEATRDPAALPSQGDVAVSGRFDGGYWRVGAQQLRRLVPARLGDPLRRRPIGRRRRGERAEGFGAGEHLTEAGDLIFGTAPRDVVRVHLLLGDGSTIELELRDIGLAYPVRCFGAWTEPPAHLEQASVFTADGEEVSGVTLEGLRAPGSGTFSVGRPPTP